MSDPDLPTRTEGEGETLDLPEGMRPFTQGQVLGEGYRVIERLGRGGMGEGWRAFDLKRRVEVALKALRSEFFKSERRVELLRQEVRAAREVVSPNVFRIFDLLDVEDHELVSMAHVVGATLLGVLQEQGPLELKDGRTSLRSHQPPPGARRRISHRPEDPGRPLPRLGRGAGVVMARLDWVAIGVLSRDTSRAAEQAQLELLRAMPAWKKLELVADGCETNRALVLAGLRSRHPSASEEELQRLLMGLLWGEPQATRIWGPAAPRRQ